MLKVWSSCLIIALLSSLFAFAAPVSADTPAWSAEPIPDTSGNVLGPAGIDITDIAVTADETKFYVAPGNSVSNNIVFQSTDAGMSWTTLNVPIQTDLIAVAPDDKNIIAIGRENMPIIYVTTNGGSTWKLLGTIRDKDEAPATAIYDIAISATSNGTHYIAAAGQESGEVANVWYGNIDSNAPVWRESNSLPDFHSTNVMKAIAFSPNFSSDKVMVTVGESDNVSVDFEIFSFSAEKWNASAGFPDYPLTIASDDGITDLTSASISLEPKYLGSDSDRRIAFIGLTVNGDAAAMKTSGIYRLTNNQSEELKTGVNIHSVAFNGINLVAGADDSNTVYYSNNPLGSIPTLSTGPSLKRPGGENRTVVGWYGNDVIAGTSGNESAFAISENRGNAFNDVSLIDTALTNLRDVAVSADGDDVYLVTDDDNDLSLWHKTSSWERVFSKQNTADYLVRLAPEDAEAVYVAEKDARNIYHSPDGGETEWSAHTCVVDIQDLAVESANVAYALNREGEVAKSTNAGLSWGAAESTNLDLNTGYMIVSAAENYILVGSTNGYVAYSTNGNSSWHKISQIIQGGAGRVQLAADSNFTTSKIIYAASDKTRHNIKKWTIGSSNTWIDIFRNVVVGGIYGLATDGNALYALEFDAYHKQSTLWQCLLPTTVSESSSSWEPRTTTTSTDATDTEVFLNATPQALRASSDGKLWTIKTNGTNRLYSLAEIMDRLTLEKPPPDFTNPINQVTGAVNEMTFAWERPFTAATEYKLYIAYDEHFEQPATVITVNSDQSKIIVPVGPDREGDARVDLVLGNTYYWRVRVTRPHYNLYSETRRFSVEPLEATPPVIVEHPPPEVINVPLPPTLKAAPPKVTLTPAPSPPPQEIIVVPAPASPVSPVPALAIVGFFVILLAVVVILITQTEWLPKLKKVKAEQHGEDTGEIVARAKEICGITKPNGEMTSDEIRKVLQWLGEQAPDTTRVNDKPVFGRIGLGVISMVMQSEFPDFYRQHSPSEFTTENSE
ncbi:hypothetical protein ACFLW9_01385 [Chloroflexota bacterium]